MKCLPAWSIAWCASCRSQGHALGRRRRAVRAPGARPGDAARPARGARLGARPRVRQPHAGPSLHGQARSSRSLGADEYDQRCCGTKAAWSAASPSAGPRSSAAAHGRSGAPGCGPRRRIRTCSTKSRRWSSTRASTSARSTPSFLDVPQECLILTMRQNQKYFPLFDRSGKLLPRFLIVSNMKVADPRHIIGGNERVVRPRLEDARFFYDQDRKLRLEARVPQLAKVVYHNKLGTPARAGAARAAARREDRARSSKADAAAGRARRLAVQGRSAHRHGGRVPRAAGRDGALLRAARRRAARGRRRDRGALPPALRRRPLARGPGRLRA